MEKIDLSSVLAPIFNSWHLINELSGVGSHSVAIPFSPDYGLDFDGEIVGCVPFY